MADDATRVVAGSVDESGDGPDDTSAGPGPLGRGDQVGRYVVLDPVGAGGMGLVYAAYDPELDRKVALKILLRGGPRGPESTRAEARLLREAQAMAKLTHPNVVAVYDAGTINKQVFIAMEFVEGITLKEWLENSGRSWRDAIELFMAAGRGLVAAHAVGLVHRDFKPANVMIRTGGEVRVLDFGLALLLEDDAPPDLADPSLDASTSGSRRSMSQQLTRTGLVSGTPAYMAPEQFRASHVDERSDQFSYCIALYEALYGERPFGTHEYEKLAEAVQQGKVRDAPAGARVPIRVRKIVLRGLSVAPEDRFEDIATLLEALQSAVTPWHRRPVTWAAVGGAGAIALAAAAWGAQPEDVDPCPDPSPRLAGIWDDARQADVSAAFTATGLVYADEARHRTTRVLDKYVEDWTRAHADACEATHVRHEQSEGLLDLRMTCLSERLAQIGSFTELLALADAQTVEKSVQAAMALGDLQRCADAATLTAALPPPDDAAAAAEVESLRTELGRIEVLGATGKLKECLAASAPVVERARATGYDPVIGEAILALGSIQGSTGAGEQGYENLTEALLIAEGTGHAELEFKARVALISVAGYRLARHEEGHQHADFARALRRRVTPTDRTIGALDIAEGLAFYAEGKFDEAIQMLDAGLAEKARVFGSDHPEIANVLVNRGAILVSFGRFDEADQSLRRAIEIYEDSIGAIHPQVGAATHNLALLYLKQGEFERAEKTLEKALEIWGQVLPAGHADIALAEQNMGVIKLKLGDAAAGLDHYQKALQIKLDTLGPSHPSVAVARANISDAHNALGHPEQGLAEALRAAEVAEASVGEEHPMRAGIYAALAESQLRTGQTEDAIATLKRTMALMEEATVDAIDVGDVKLLLARAHHQRGDDPAMVKRLAEEALQLYRGRGAAAGDEIDEADAFLRRLP